MSKYTKKINKKKFIKQQPIFSPKQFKTFKENINFLFKEVEPFKDLYNKNKEILIINHRFNALYKVKNIWHLETSIREIMHLEIYRFSFTDILPKKLGISNEIQQNASKNVVINPNGTFIPPLKGKIIKYTMNNQDFYEVKDPEIVNGILKQKNKRNKDISFWNDKTIEERKKDFDTLEGKKLAIIDYGEMSELNALNKLNDDEKIYLKLIKEHFNI